MRHWGISVNLISALKLSWLIVYKIDIMSLELTLMIVFQSQNKVNENSLNLKKGVCVYFKFYCFFIVV